MVWPFVACCQRVLQQIINCMYISSRRMAPSKKTCLVRAVVLVNAMALVLVLTHWSQINEKYQLAVMVHSVLRNNYVVKNVSFERIEDNPVFQPKLTIQEVVKTEAPLAVVSWLHQQSIRKQHLDETCRANKSLSMNLTDIIQNRRRLLWPYIVDDKYRILYGFISKVGSTHWKSAFLVLKGKFKRVEDIPGSRAHDPSLRKLSSYSPDEIEYRLRNYTTFIFVRDPLARVLSAFRSKLEEDNRPFQKTFGTAIIKRYRQNPSQIELQTGVNVTFAEFVRFITDKGVKHNMDGHWQPIYQMVLPCNVKYDYIGKLETAKEDADNILKLLHLDHLIHFKESTRNTSHTKEIFNKYYKSISPEYVNKLYELYSPDFQLFGYSMAEDLTQRQNILLN